MIHGTLLVGDPAGPVATDPADAGVPVASEISAVADMSDAGVATDTAPNATVVVPLIMRTAPPTPKAQATPRTGRQRSVRVRSPISRREWLSGRFSLSRCCSG